MRDVFNTAVEEAGRLASRGQAWEALACLQSVEIEDVLLRLLHGDLRSMPLPEREEAVGHAVTALYEQWAAGRRVPSVLGFLKVSARNRANSLRRTRLAPEPLDPDRHQPEALGESPDDDPVERRRRAVKAARALLPELGMQSLIDTFSYYLDLVEAGEDARSSVIARDLGLKETNVTSHLKRGLDRLEARRGRADVEALLAEPLDHDTPDDTEDEL